MENNYNNIHKFKIPVRTSPSPNFLNGYGFVHNNGNTRALGVFPQFDFYLPVFITRTGNLMEYVNITQDETIFTMERQEVNPFFVEFGFFDSIVMNKVNNGADLTSTMKTYIKTARPETSAFTDAQLIVWFDDIGKLDFPWNAGAGVSGETTIDTLDKLEFLNDHIISKAFYYNIDINK